MNWKKKIKKGRKQRNEKEEKKAKKKNNNNKKTTAIKAKRNIIGYLQRIVQLTSQRFRRQEKRKEIKLT